MSEIQLKFVMLAIAGFSVDITCFRLDVTAKSIYVSKMFEYQEVQSEMNLYIAYCIYSACQNFHFRTKFQLIKCIAVSFLCQL